MGGVKKRAELLIYLDHDVLRAGCFLSFIHPALDNLSRALPKHVLQEE